MLSHARTAQLQAAALVRTHEHMVALAGAKDTPAYAQALKEAGLTPVASSQPIRCDEKKGFNIKSEYTSNGYESDDVTFAS